MYPITLGGTWQQLRRHSMSLIQPETFLFFVSSNSEHGHLMKASIALRTSSYKFWFSKMNILTFGSIIIIIYFRHMHEITFWRFDYNPTQWYWQKNWNHILSTTIILIFIWITNVIIKSNVKNPIQDI